MEDAKVRVAKAQDTNRVRLTDINPHIVCVLCHGYFVDATTITECLHSFCRSCIFRHLETKSYCPICEVQVHTRLHRSLKSDKTLQDIVYKLVPGLFHNEMERRREFYKNHPHRDEHLEAERRGLGLNRLIYSPTDTISLSLEFYDTEREREEWASVTCPSQQQDVVKPNAKNNLSNNNNNKRYLQCPAVFKMGHLKKFMRQKYNLPPTANVEIIYKRESLPDSYSLMDVAYIYTWKRNGPMRFYYRIPDVVEFAPDIAGDDKITNQKGKSSTEPPSKPVEKKEEDLPIEAAKCEEVTTSKDEMKSDNNIVEKQVNTKVEKPAEKQEAKKEEKVVLESQCKTKAECENKSTSDSSAQIITKDEDKVNQSSEVKKIDEKTSKSPEEPSTVPPLPVTEKKEVVQEPSKDADSTNNLKTASDVEREMQKNKEIIESKKEDVLKENNGVQISKQDELPVSVLLSLGKCRVGKPTAESGKQETVSNGLVNGLNGTAKGPEIKPKSLSNGRANLNKIANELQQKAVGNSLQKVSKENISQAVPSQLPRPVQHSPKHQPFNLPTTPNGKPPPPKQPKKCNSPQRQAPPYTTNGSVMGVMDQRIQQLYRSGGVSPANKSESRLASWLNNRFQPKTQVRQMGSVGPKPQQANGPVPIQPRPPAYRADVGSQNGNKVKNGMLPHGMKELLTNGLKMDPRPIQQTSPFPRIPTPKSIPNGGETPRTPKDSPRHPTNDKVQTPPSGVSPSLQKPAPSLQKPAPSPPVPRPPAPPQAPQNPSSKLDEEVSKLKRKLEELKKMNDSKGREVGGCRITQENPDPEAAKKMRDLTPVVSIELMRGGKRPVPGLKAIQEIVELGKRKGEDKKQQQPEKKLKLTTQKKEGEDVLDLSRCAPPPPPTSASMPHWFNPVLRHYMPSNK